jgi:hypothetical protein
MSQKMALWLVPILLAVHNLEEAIFVRRVLLAAKEQLPRMLHHAVGGVSYSQFIVALLIVTTIPFVAAAAGRLEKRGGVTVYLLLAIQAVMLLNVFSHVGGLLFLRGYSPGLPTALLINFPFSVYLLHRAARERWVSRTAFVSLLPVALVLHGPVLIGLMLLAGFVHRGV